MYLLQVEKGLRVTAIMQAGSAQYIGIRVVYCSFLHVFYNT
jgi:hypothetical protein